MIKIKRIVLVSGMAMGLCACDFMTIPFDDQGQGQQQEQQQEEEQEEAASPKKASKMSEDEGSGKIGKQGQLAITMAKMQVKIDELESQVRRQREDFHVLRKGLMTGLIPSDWRDDIPKYASKEDAMGHQADRQYKAESLSVMLGKNEGSGGQGFAGLTDAERRRYEQKIATANHYFRAGDYGKAIAAYERIGEEYSDKVTKGNHLLWMGAGWFQLRDYQLARRHLTNLMDHYKTSPWIPEAKFILAKIDFREGFVEKSVTRFKDIMNQYPSESVAERAREELRRVEENL